MGGSKVWRRTGGGNPSVAVGVVPQGQRIYAVGDIHGCQIHFEEILKLIENDAQGYQGTITLVTLGDYHNRGPASRQVFDTLTTPSWPSNWQHIALRGNHEQALLDFIANPTRQPDWLSWGGLETLASYDINALHQGRPRTPESLAAELAETMEGQGHLAFVRNTVLTHTVGSYLFVHAGVRRGVPLARQIPSDMMFLHRNEFMAAPHGLPYRVVFGHSIWETPLIQPDRIGIDTGAYQGGPLTAVRLEGDSAHILQTKGRA
ncbi:MAG: metallophosphoesterase [Alphaproteobacteria bacterium]